MTDSIPSTTSQRTRFRGLSWYLRGFEEFSAMLNADFNRQRLPMQL